MSAKNIFVVFGEEIDKEFSNIKTIDTKVVPNIGEQIAISRTAYKVVNKLIDYSSVEDYELKDVDRGRERIYIFVKNR